MVEQDLATTDVPRFQLYDLSVVPGETDDVIERHPEIAVRLKMRLEEIIAAGSSRPAR